MKYINNVKCPTCGSDYNLIKINSNILGVCSNNNCDETIGFATLVYFYLKLEGWYNMVGKRIRQLRKEKGVTQSELANYLGLTPKMISFYELENRYPPHDIILKISDYFNVSTDYLLGKSDVKNPERIVSDYDSLSEESQKQLEKYIELLKIKDAQDKSRNEMSLTSEYGT